MSMTLDQLNTLRDQLIKNAGVVRSQYQGRMIEFSAGDQRAKDLAVIDAEIARVTDVISGKPTSRCTLATFRRD